MNNGSSARSIVETALLSAISVIIIAASFFVPVFYFVGYFLWPIPLALIYIRHGLKFGLSSIFVTAVLTVIVANPVFAITATLMYGGVGLALGYSVRKKESVSFTVLIVFAVAFITTLVTIKALNMVMGFDVITESLNTTINSVKSMKNLYISSGVSEKQFDEFFKTILNVETIKSIIPAAFVTYSIITAFLSYWMFEKIASRLKYKVEKLKPFSEIYISNGFSVGFFLLAVAGYLFLTYSGISKDVYMMNLFMIFSFIFSIAGLSVVTFFMRKKGIPKAVVFIIGMFLIMSVLSQILVYVGLADNVFNFRKLDIKRRYNKRK